MQRVRQPRPKRRPIGLVRWLGSAAACLGCMSDPDVVAIRRVPAEPELLALSGDIEAHDPSAWHDGETTWVFSTGERLPVHASTDLSSFELSGNAFDVLPAWAAEQVPEATGFWSPDVALFGGRYHLYYALSTFGSSESCIGHATAVRVGAAGVWTDQGALICSSADSDWNAIDPNVLVDDDGKVWLVLGSYRTGLKLIAIDPETGRRLGSDFIPLAQRPDPGMIQAAALTRRGAYYYLFSAFDECCLGADSTHRLMVGRATAVRGPYVDRDGVGLLEGGGTLVLEGDARWRGPGSNDVLDVAGVTYNVYHAYDADNDGRATLRISTLVWDEDGWPVSAGP